MMIYLPNLKSTMNNVYRQTWTVFVKSLKFNEILAISGILVLQQSQYGSHPVDLSPFWLLKGMHGHYINTRYKFEPFNTNAAKNMSVILNYAKGQIDEDSARIRLLGLCTDLEEEERPVIRAIVDLKGGTYHRL
ncbi:unnamed protein product [Mucor fragilis]